LRKLTKRQVEKYNNYIIALEKEDRFDYILEAANLLLEYIDKMKDYTYISSAYYNACLNHDLKEKTKIYNFLNKNKNKFKISFAVNIFKEQYFFFEILEINNENIITKRKSTRTNAKSILKTIQNILFLRNKIKYEKLIKKIHIYISTKSNLDKNILEEIRVPEIKLKQHVNLTSKKKNNRNKKQYKSIYKKLEIKSLAIKCYIKEFAMLDLSKKQIRKRKQELKALRAKEKAEPNSNKYDRFKSIDKKLEIKSLSINCYTKEFSMLDLSKKQIRKRKQELKALRAKEKAA